MLTFTAKPTIGFYPNGGGAYYILEQTYGTYWLDLEQTKEFLPVEIPKIDRYNFRIHLLKYQS